VEKKNKFPKFIEGDVVDKDFPPIKKEIVVKIRPIISQQEFEELKAKILQQELP